MSEDIERVEPTHEVRARQLVRSVHYQGDNAPFQSLHIETLIRVIGRELEALESSTAALRAELAETRGELEQRDAGFMAQLKMNNRLNRSRREIIVERDEARTELAQAREEQRRGEEALRAALPIIEELSVEESYGAPYCDDPRDFRPDRECNTPAEIAAWEDACRRAEAGETVEVPRHQWISGEAAQVREAVTTAVQEGASSGSVSNRAGGMAIGHIASEPWGVGTSTVRDAVMAKLAETIRAALASPDAPTREVSGE